MRENDIKKGEISTYPIYTNITYICSVRLGYIENRMCCRSFGVYQESVKLLTDLKKGESTTNMITYRNNSRFGYG